MYCAECYIQDGHGTVPGVYIFRGKSLCMSHFWTEVETPEVLVKPEAKPKRGTRLPEGWEPADATIGKMCDELHTSAFYLKREHLKFCDYFWSAPGQKGVKVDWDRAWCNWMRGASERGTFTRVLTTADKSRGWMELDGHAEGE